MITESFDPRTPAIINAVRNPNAPHVDACIMTFSYLIERAVSDSAVIEFSSSGHFPFITERARFLAVLRSFFAI